MTSAVLGTSKTRTAISALTIINKKAFYIPKFIEGVAKSLEGIGIINCRLKSIDKRDLKQFTNLRGLWLVDNDLEVLESDLFEFTTKLEIINFSGNQLKLVESNVLEPLKNLKQAFFKNVGCVNYSAESSKELKELKKKLGECETPEMKKIKSELSELQNVNKRLEAKEVLAFDKIEMLESQIVDLMNNITELEEKVNNETSLEADNFDLQEQIAELRNVSCNSNQLSEEISLLEGNLTMYENQTCATEELEQEITNLKDEIALLWLKVQSADKNLDGATKKLLVAMRNRNMKASIADKHKVEVSCVTPTNETSVAICRVTELSVTDVGTEISLAEDMNANQLTILIIHQQPTLFLPTNIAETFPNLNELEVTETAIFLIDSNNFLGLSQLKILNLSRNKLSEIPTESFKDLKILETLDLSMNNIETIAVGAFEGLDELRTLNLNANKINSMRLHTFENLTKLEMLMVSENLVKYISPKLLATFEATIKFVDFTSNECISVSFPETDLAKLQQEIVSKCITQIEHECEFKENKTEICFAKELNVESSKAKIFKVNGQGSFKDVTALVIENQIMNFMPQQLSKVFPKLEKLSIIASQLTTLSIDSFSGLKSLKWLEIRDNNLTSIDAQTFSAVPQLERLDLSSNHIQSLPSKVFGDLSALKKLILSDNQLTTLKLDILPQTTSIDDFQATNNTLRGIDPYMLRLLRNATTIDFSGNVCADNLKYEKVEGDANALMTFSGAIAFNCPLE